MYEEKIITQLQDFTFKLRYYLHTRGQTVVRWKGKKDERSSERQSIRQLVALKNIILCIFPSDGLCVGLEDPFICVRAHSFHNTVIIQQHQSKL